MKKLLFFLVGLLLLPGQAAFALPDFINGGFEQGNTNGWALSGQTSIKGPGLDIRTNNELSVVYNGDWAAKVGDEYSFGWSSNGPNPPPVNDQYSSISQIETVGAGDLEDLYFYWAAVALQPANFHELWETPYFRVDVNWYHQGGGMTDLLTEEHWAGDGDSDWRPGIVDDGTQYGGNYGGAGGLMTWYYRPWSEFHLNLASYGIQAGDQLEAVLTTRDCELTGHASYAYLDGFGATPISQVPEPSSLLLLGSGLVGLAGVARRRFRR